MPAPVPTAILCLLTGLSVGTVGGYFWGADSQPVPLAKPDQAKPGLASNPKANSSDSSAGLSALLQNPTGLRLVGTVVQPEHGKSRAWLLEEATKNTQAYGEGDALPGGYKLITIGAEDLQVTKDGYSFSIRRSSPSGETASAPCEALAQNASNAQNPRGGSEPGRRVPGKAVLTNPSFGIFDSSGRRQTSRDNPATSSQPSSGGSQNQNGSGGGRDGGNSADSAASGNSNAQKSKTRNWGQKAPVADGEDMRSSSGDALSTLKEDDEP